MTQASEPDHANSILVYAPIGRDAELTQDLLAHAGIVCVLCRSIADMYATFEELGGGVLLLTEEALDDPVFAQLVEALEHQPAWSDVPVLLFAGTPGQDVTARTVRSTASLHNVTLLERPIGLTAVLTTIRTALRSRSRQYEVRDLLVALHRARADAERANRLKDEFLATLSHELRTPLNAILGWTSMLTRGQVDRRRMPMVFETLDRNAQAQAQLIADVLDISRIITGKLQLQLSIVDVGEVMTRALDTIRPAASVRQMFLDVRTATGCFVHGDVDRLQQVFWNLLSNALKFTPPGGTIRVDIAEHESSIAVAVSDTGVGIAPEFLPLVFDRFRQEDQSLTRVHGGLGLGLAIVKHLVELHGGTVSAASDGPGRGASFRVMLPAAARRADLTAPSRHERAERGVPLAGRLVLVVDDDAATREVMAAALEHARARVRLAGSAAEGWAALQRERPDIIVADLGVPAEAGFAFIRRVRRVLPEERLPAIALSAYADPASRQAALAAGFSAFVAKPARPQAVIRMIDSLLTASPTRRRA